MFVAHSKFRPNAFVCAVWPKRKIASSKVLDDDITDHVTPIVCCSFNGICIDELPAVVVLVDAVTSDLKISLCRCYAEHVSRSKRLH